MQPSNQQPAETDKQQAEAIPEAGGLGSGEVAFYEFPAEGLEQQPVPGASSPIPAEKIPPVEVSAQDIQSGLVYPPPPSFYQNMQVPAEKPPLPSPVLPVPVPPASNQPYPGMPFRPPHPAMVPPTQAHGSRKKYWIILSVLSTVLLLSCGLCSWWAYSAIGPLIQDTTSITYTVTNYYQHIEQADYEAAYTYLSIENVSQASFIEQAQQRDDELGSVSSFEVSGANPQYSVDDNSDLSISVFSVSISVVRGASESYNAHLNLQKIEGKWRITSFDLI